MINKEKTMWLRSAILPLIILNVIIFVLQKFIPGLTELFMLISHDIFSRPWILITSMFLHANSAHLLFNMYALLIFGPLIEQRIGIRRFLGIYFSSGIVAALVFSLFQLFILKIPGAAVGASGGMMGVIGMTIMLLPDLRVLFFFVVPMSMRTAGIVIAVIDLIGVFGIGIPGIANIAHLGGLICGVFYGFHLIKQREKFTEKFTSQQKRKKSSLNKTDNSNKTIEMTEQDIEEYLKNGRI
jgi:membrane associated rhomboid family serine protease